MAREIKLKGWLKWDAPVPRPEQERNPKDLAEFLRWVAEDLPRGRLPEQQLVAIALAARQLADRANELLMQQRALADDRHRAVELLGAIKEAHGATLTFLEVKNWEDWRIAEDVNADNCKRLRSGLTALRQALQEYERLRGMAAPTRSAQVALEKQCREKEAEIDRLIGELLPLLLPLAEEEEAADVQPVAHTDVPASDEPIQRPEGPDGAAGLEAEPASATVADTQQDSEAGATVADTQQDSETGTEQQAGSEPEVAMVLETLDGIETSEEPPEDSPPPQAPSIAATGPGAEELPTEPVSTAYEVTFARLLGTGCLSEAFWLAHVASQRGLQGVCPDWLVRAAFLADYVTGYDQEAADEWYQVAQAHPTAWQEASQVCDRRTAAYLVVAASLQPALLAPETGAVSWLQEVQRELSELLPGLDAVVEVAARGRRVQALSKGLDLAQAHEHLAQEVRRWLDRARNATFSYRMATQLMRYFGSSSSPTGRLAQWIIENRFDELHAARALASRLQEDRVDDLIDSALAQTINSPKRPSLEGRIREAIRHRLRQLALLANAWLEMLEPPERKAPDRAAEAAFRKLVNALRSMAAHLEVASANADSIGELQGNAAARLLHDRIQRLLEQVTGTTASEPVTKASWLRALQRPLLQLRPCPIEVPETLPLPLPPAYHDALITALEHPRALSEAFHQHVADGNLLAARLVLELVEAEDPRQSERLRAQLATAFSALIEETQQAIGRLEARIEQETIDHVLSEGERSRLLATLAGLRERVASRDPYIRRDRIEADLKEVQQRLGEARRTRVEALRDRIEQARDSLREAASGLTDVPAWLANALHYLEKASQALDRGDVALADEYVTLVEEAVSTQQAPRPPREDLEELASYVEGFAEAQTRLYKDLDEAAGANVVNRLANGHDFSCISTRHLSTATREELRQGLSAYLHLKSIMSRGGIGLLNALDRLEQLLFYMGFYDPKVDRQPIKGSDLFPAFRVAMTDSGYSPLPEFGSERNGTYYVVLVGGRPPIDRIGQGISTLGLTRKAPIVIYFGRLTSLQRAEWAQYCRQHRLTALLVDELILFYVASERKLRLRRLIALSLAWGFANPYSPSAAGSVPPEMFKGRQEIISELLDPHGSGIIYGGRQLGKSAILRAVERQASSQYAEGAGARVCYLDIKQLGSKDAAAVRHPSYLWTMLRQWLVDQGLLPPSVGDSPVSLRNRILERFKMDKELQIYLLLDEADNFLEADAREEFKTLQQLKEISDATNRRFKVVLCGLHSVQRYALLPNQPLAHVGQPIVVGPLSPEAALELIREPMAILGYHFNSDEPLYRILCYTNYHPALIQHFCRELIEALTPRRPHDRPTYRITLADVEQVYQRREVRNVIRDRFEWTIALDDRYQALVYAIAEDQVRLRDGYRKEYNPSSVLALARNVWPEAFDSMGPDEVRVLLDELVGLGVLVKSPTGAYRLRNGNVVRALGSAEEIEERAAQFLYRGAPLPQFDPKNTSVVLDRRTGEFSPLTLQQESIVNGQESGTCLLVASDALGLRKIWRALSRFGQGAGQEEGVYDRMEPLPANIVTYQSIINYLDAVRRDLRRGRALFYVEARNLHAAEGLSVLATRLAEWLTRTARRDRVLRVVLLLDPGMLYRWQLEPESAREHAEGLATGLVVPRLVVDTALERYLRALDVLHNVEIRMHVQRATGGWPWLLDRLMTLATERSGGRLEGVDLREDADRLLLETRPGTDVSTAFTAALGLHDIPYAREVLFSIYQLGVVPLEEMSVDLLDPCPDGIDERALQAVLRTLEQLRMLVPRQGGVQVEPTVARVLGFDTTA